MSAEVSDVIMLLLSRGANPNVSSVPLNPMFYTVLGGEVDVVKRLLESGARTDQHLPDEVNPGGPMPTAFLGLNSFTNILQK